MRVHDEMMILRGALGSNVSCCDHPSAHFLRPPGWIVPALRPSACFVWCPLFFSALFSGWLKKNQLSSGEQLVEK